MLTTSLPEYVTVSVNDLGFNELSNFWRKEDSLAIKIDLAGRFDSTSTHFGIQQSELHKSLAAALPSTADIKQFYPKEINVGYKRLYQKKVPVKLMQRKPQPSVHTQKPGEIQSGHCEHLRS